MTYVPNKEEQKGELKGGHALLYFLGFFGLMFAVNGVFLYHAITSFPGEDVPKSYMQGLAYNETLAARAAQQNAGWGAEIGQMNGELVFRLRSANGAPVVGADVTAELRWPATREKDVLLHMVEDKSGQYIAPLRGLETGVWEVRIKAVHPSASNELFEARKTLVLK